MNTERLRLSPRNRMILLGILIALFICVFLFDYVRGMNLKQKCTSQTTGTITEVRKNSSRSSHSYYATIQYRIGGQVISFVSRCSYRDKTGDRVTVHYNPENVKERYAFDNPYGVAKLKERFLILLFVIPVWIFMAKRQNQKEIDP